MKQTQTDKAPAAIGPYSQAIETAGFIFCSGQIGIDPKTNNLVDGLEAQTKQILDNLSAVLKAANSSFKQVVKTTIYITNINDFPKVNEIYGSFFQNHHPARATVTVVALPKDALIEIEAIAIKK